LVKAEATDSKALNSKPAAAEGSVYGWLPVVDHALNYSSGGFPTLRHNKLRDFTATVLSRVYHDAMMLP